MMKKVLRIFANKYVLAGSAFLIWTAFFDQNDWQSMRKKRQELEDTQNDITYLNQEIARMEKEHEQLTSNPAKLEQFAREKYRMKRDNEDLYIIEGKE